MRRECRSHSLTKDMKFGEIQFTVEKDDYYSAHKHPPSIANCSRRLSQRLIRFISDCLPVFYSRSFAAQRRFG